MEFQYKKLMEENDLKLKELPQDAQTGISEIAKVVRGVQMRERNGKKALPSTLTKIKAMDKWVTYEILDYLHDTDENDDKIPFKADDVIGDKKEDENPIDEKELQKGLKIEAELDKLMAEGQNKLSIDDLRSKAHATYSEVWDNYEEDEENGIITTKYSLIEDDEYEFNLKLNK